MASKQTKPHAGRGSEVAGKPLLKETVRITLKSPETLAREAEVERRAAYAAERGWLYDDATDSYVSD